MVLAISIACGSGYSNVKDRSQARLDNVPGAGIRPSAPSLFGETTPHQRASSGGARSQGDQETIPQGEEVQRP